MRPEKYPGPCGEEPDDVIFESSRIIMFLFASSPASSERRPMICKHDGSMNDATLIKWRAAMNGVIVLS